MMKNVQIKSEKLVPVEKQSSGNNDNNNRMNVKWGEIRLEKLPRDLIDTARLKQEKPVLIDQPLLPAILSPANVLPKSSSTKKHEQPSNKTHKKKPSRIDSYIVNTIRLNQILKSRVGFDQVEMFRKSTTTNENKIKSSTTKKASRRASSCGKSNVDETSEQARLHLKQFVTIMCLHAGFNDISSISMDILIDLLDHFLESFFKIMKNLQSVNLFDVQESTNNNAPPSNFYHSETFIEQAMLESGLGSIRDLKDYYLNDIVLYYRSTYDKVNKMYEAYKRSKYGYKMEGDGTDGEGMIHSPLDIGEHDGDPNDDLEMDEFMKNNELLNDESNLILGEFLNDLNTSHLDEEINKMLQMIGPDPFGLDPDSA